ncbi:MAG: cyclic nucleotide-binding domain-containing protein [Deltaproteobacteria bacterium]|nr:MAG: cyclic nucleotide-binding domain-containing protein [Deltaproteobacteria bacterium]
MHPTSGEQAGIAVPGTVSSSGLLAALTPAERAVVAGYGRERLVPAGGEIWAVGAATDGLAWIEDGQVELKVDTEFPGKQIVVGVFAAGSVIGASGVLECQPRATAAKALVPTTLLLLDRERFDALAADHPHLAIKVLKALLLAEATRLRKAYARLASIF